MTIDRNWLHSDGHYRKDEIQKVREYFENNDVTKSDISKLRWMIYKDMKVASELELQKDFDKKEIKKLVMRIKNKDQASFNLLVKKRIITKEGKLREPWSGYKWMHIIQVALNLEWYTGKNGKKLIVDGKYGANTFWALINYQKKDDKYHNTILNGRWWEPDGITDGRTIISLIKEEPVTQEDPTEKKTTDSDSSNSDIQIYKQQDDTQQCPVSEPDLLGRKDNTIPYDKPQTEKTEVSKEGEQDELKHKEKKQETIKAEEDLLIEKQKVNHVRLVQEGVNDTKVEEWKSHTFTLKLDQPVNKETVVHISIKKVLDTNDDMVVSSDLESTGVMDVTIPAWKDEVTFSIKTKDDDLVEQKEVFDVQIVWTDNPNVKPNWQFDHEEIVILDNDKEKINENILNKYDLLWKVIEVWVYNALQKKWTKFWIEDDSIDSAVKKMYEIYNNIDLHTDDLNKIIRDIFDQMYSVEDLWFTDIVDKVDLQYVERKLERYNKDKDNKDYILLDIYRVLRQGEWVDIKDTGASINRAYDDGDEDVVEFETLQASNDKNIQIIKDVIQKSFDGENFVIARFVNNLKSISFFNTSTQEGRENIDKLSRILKFYKIRFRADFFEEGSTYTTISEKWDEKLNRYYDNMVIMWKIDPKKLDINTFKKQAFDKLLALNAEHIASRFVLALSEMRWNERKTNIWMYADIQWLAETDSIWLDFFDTKDSSLDFSSNDNITINFFWKDRIYGLEKFYNK